MPHQIPREGPMKVELFIGRRYFRSRPKQTIIALTSLFSIIGVTIGVTALIVVIGVMAGFESDLKSRIMGIEPHIVMDQDGQPFANYSRMVASAGRLPGVSAVWPVVELQAILKTDTRISGAAIKGVEARSAAQGLNIPSLDLLRDPAVPASEGPGRSSVPPIVLGQDLGRVLGVIKGDTLFVVSPKGSLAPTGFIPSMKRFQVVGFFETGMYEYDGSLAFMRLEAAQALIHAPSAVSAVEIRVENIYEVPMIADQVRAENGAGFRLRDWRQMNRNLFSALKLEKTAMFITLTLIILVATFSIVGSLVMLVMEKTKDIAVLKTIGATSGLIRRIFVFQGMLIGFVGTALGVCVGSGLCYMQKNYQLIRLPGDVYYIAALPVDLQLFDVCLVAFSALLICFVATLYPAHQASRFKTVEALRYG
jgi:lipoprotein-releasing system permease protein